jgi:hypothetical protein
MPITPFHFGPAAALKAVAPRHFSFTMFVFTNVVIDVEPLYFMATGGWPIHRFCHTYLGATVVAMACFFVGRPVCSWALRLWNSRLDAAQARWLGVETRIAALPALTGALIGGWSHVLLDSLMHPDMEPLAPFAGGNDMLQFVTLGELELFCVLSGVLGVAILLATAVVQRRGR